MTFGLQMEESQNISIDVRILRDELDKLKYQHKYMYMKSKDVQDPICSTPEIESMNTKDIIPVGDLLFVGDWLQKYYGIENMNPIEVPGILRTEEFLKRKYSIVSKEELPSSGIYFVKYASKLKVFSYTGAITHLFDSSLEYAGKIKLDEGLYQVSEQVDILSEYRVFVFRDEVINMVNYDGNPLTMPDTALLRKMVNMYMYDNERPGAYTMDIAVMKDRGTALLEVHPFVSVGLYGYLFGSKLPYCYSEGINYYIKTNKPLSKYSNF